MIILDTLVQMTSISVKPQLDINTIKNNSIILEYVWLGFDNILRSKYKTIYVDILDKISNIEQIPRWNYDGSSTGQAP